MTEGSNQSTRDVLDRLNRIYFETLYEVKDQEELKKIHEDIIRQAISWAKENPSDILYLISLAKGKSGHDLLLRSSSNPLFYEALGRLGKVEVIPYLREILEKCNKRGVVCHHLKEVFRALLQIDDEQSVETIQTLLKKPKGSKLLMPFISALRELPNPKYLPVIVNLSKEGYSYYFDLILAKMIINKEFPIDQLLKHTDKRVREVTIRAIAISDMEFRPIDLLQTMLENDKEDWFIKTQIADILKDMGIVVPPEYRDRKPNNISDNLPRLIRGVIHPESRDDDWALTEIVQIPKTPSIDDSIRMEFRFVASSLFADIKIWRGCFWDVFKIGFSISKIIWPRNSYRITGITRATFIQSENYQEDEMVNNFGTIILNLLNDYVENLGEKYVSIIETINRAVKENIDLVYVGVPTWDFDDEKANYSGC